MLTMKKRKDIELRQRAMKLLGVSTIYDADEIKRNFRRQIKLVSPHGPDRDTEVVQGYPNDVIARLIIQAYRLLTSGHAPTTLIEDDDLVGTLLDGDITPISETVTEEEWNANQYYDQFKHSIWPEASERDKASARHKFGRGDHKRSD